MSNQMKEIDWSKAPEGATHYSPEAFGCYAAFWQLDGEKVVQSWVFEEKDRLEHYVDGAISQGTRQRLIARSAPWTGEGLPPVGTHVVIHDDGTLMYGQGESGEVIAHVEDCAVVRMSYGLGCFTAEYLRTPEQIAAEEREKTVQQMLEDANSWGALPAAVCLALYKAGYRKVTP